MDVNDSYVCLQRGMRGDAFYSERSSRKPRGGGGIPGAIEMRQTVGAKVQTEALEPMHVVPGTTSTERALGPKRVPGSSFHWERALEPRCRGAPCGEGPLA
jgi:hypothetical protein